MVEHLLVTRQALVAQPVEHLHGKQKVTGSIPVEGSRNPLEEEQVQMAKQKSSNGRSHTYQCRNDWSRRPWQDDVDSGDHRRAVEEGAWRTTYRLTTSTRLRKRKRVGSRSRRRTWSIRRKSPLRARGLSGPRGLCQEHDHGCGPDGRGDIGGKRGRWADAADTGARAFGSTGKRALHRGVFEQGGHGGRSGVVGAWWSWRCGSC